MTARKKKDGKSLNCVIERSIYERLEEYCEYAGQKKTTAVERILKQFFDELDNADSAKGIRNGH